MGCPQRNIEKSGAGAALIKNPVLAQEIIAAAKSGAEDMRVSVKTRVGYKNADEIAKWVTCLLKAKPAAITFHLRTRKQMSKVPAQWDLIKIPVAMAKGSGIMILGNGDVKSMEEARQKAEQYGVDGVMIGRAVLGNPWIFSFQGTAPQGGMVTLEERLRVMVEHAKLFEKLFCETPTNQKLFGGHKKSFAIMKKHLHAYASGFSGAAALRKKLMETSNAYEVAQAVKE